MPKTRLGAFCDKLIEAGWLAAIVVVPLFFDVYSSRVFEPDKITTLRSIAVVMAVAWLVKFIEGGLQVGEESAEASGGLGRLWKRAVRTPLVLPTLALMLVYLVATAFSLVPRTSLLGSYQRLQGTYSMLSYVVVFVMMLQGVRSREQVERFVTTVVLTSIPISLYGILQHYGLDPLPWGGDVRIRVAGNMGNAIFVAAYLIMAIPLTLYRTVESFTALLSAEKGRFVDIVLGAVYIFVLAIQAICIFFTQSRGPWLGLVGGLFFFFLVLAVVRRWRWLVWGVVVVVLAAAGFLVVFNVPSSPLGSLRAIPYIGRLGRVLDKEEATSRVRLLIWQGAINMILPHPPIQEPDGSPDRMNWARPWIGYGPESMYVAYNRFYPPDLAQVESRNASPDRSHNETFDSLVTTGLIGFVVYMWLFMGVFYYGFRWLGIIANSRQRNLFMGCWTIGGIAGAAIMGIWQGPEFIGVGLPAGIAAGLGVYLVVWGLFLSQRSGQEVAEARPSNPFELLVVALVAAVIAHFVEIHFGIAVAATRTYFWAYTALLVVVGYLLPRHLATEVETAAHRAPVPSKRPPKRRRQRQKQKRTVPPVKPSGALSGVEAILPLALVLALILSTLAFDLVSNQKQLDSPQQVLWTSLTRRLVSEEFVPSYGILGLVGITWFVSSAVIVAEWIRRGGVGNWHAPLGACLSVSAFIAFLFALIIAGRLTSAVRQKTLLEVTRTVQGMMSSYYVLLFLLLVMAAVALLRRRASASVLVQPTSWWVYPVLLVVVVLVVINSNLKVIHADISYKQAEPWERQGMWDFSVVLHQQAINLAPHEDFYYLFLGRAFLEKAKSATVVDRPEKALTLQHVLELTPQQMSQLSRDDLLDCSDVVLQRARQINPLNTDHSANLGRLYRTRAELATDAGKKEAYFRQSLEYYAQATSLSPHAAHLFNEWGSVYLVMGDYQMAIAKYEQSLAIDQQYVNTYLALGDAYMASDDTDKAQAAYLKAVEIAPQIPEVHSVLAYLYGKQGLTQEAITETLRVLELTQDERLLYNSYKNLALFYRQVDRLDEAMQAAQQALARAPENERASVQALVEQLAAGGIAPETEVLIQQFLSEGEAALNSKQWDRAAEAYRKALGLNSNLVMAHSALSYVYAQQGRLEEAEKENLLVLAAIPDDLATLRNLAIIYRQMQNYDNSIQYARQAMQSAQAKEEDKKQLQLFINEVQNLKASG